ncbi:hypothetical protein LR48_Vigan307s000900 [Vigna angularis]|uniref:Uncharacterized protein n=1 Tax=Phaseolus angularis TaxID=3914 RepID=A0A0L9T9E1_PHAAN|nr:hypothetical protein LR48_Vigan307s000900 [Vigna angularis]
MSLTLRGDLSVQVQPVRIKDELSSESRSSGMVEQSIPPGSWRYLKSAEFCILQNSRPGAPVAPRRDWHWKCRAQHVAPEREMLRSAFARAKLDVRPNMNFVFWSVYPYTQSIVDTQVEENNVSGESRGRSSSIVFEFRHRQIGGFTLLVLEKDQLNYASAKTTDSSTVIQIRMSHVVAEIPLEQELEDTKDRGILKTGVGTSLIIEQPWSNSEVLVYVPILDIVLRTNLVDGMEYFGSVFVRGSRSHHKCITSRDCSSTYQPDECLLGIVG